MESNPDGEVLKYGVQLKFSTTNNEAEYEGILTGLRLGKAFGAKNLLIQSDSKLVIRQIKGEYEAKEERMQKYLKLTKHLRSSIHWSSCRSQGVRIWRLMKSRS